MLINNETQATYGFVFNRSMYYSKMLQGIFKASIDYHERMVNELYDKLYNSNASVRKYIENIIEQYNETLDNMKPILDRLKELENKKSVLLNYNFDKYVTKTFYQDTSIKFENELKKIYETFSNNLSNINLFKIVNELNDNLADNFIYVLNSDNLHTTYVKIDGKFEKLASMSLDTYTKLINDYNKYNNLYNRYKEIYDEYYIDIPNYFKSVDGYKLNLSDDIFEYKLSDKLITLNITDELTKFQKNNIIIDKPSYDLDNLYINSYTIKYNYDNKYISTNYQYIPKLIDNEFYNVDNHYLKSFDNNTLEFISNLDTKYSLNKLPLNLFNIIYNVNNNYSYEYTENSNSYIKLKLQLPLERSCSEFEVIESYKSQILNYDEDEFTAKLVSDYKYSISNTELKYTDIKFNRDILNDNYILGVENNSYIRYIVNVYKNNNSFINNEFDFRSIPYNIQITDLDYVENNEWYLDYFFEEYNSKIYRKLLKKYNKYNLTFITENKEIDAINFDLYVPNQFKLSKLSSSSINLRYTDSKYYIDYDFNINNKYIFDNEELDDEIKIKGTNEIVLNNIGNLLTNAYVVDNKVILESDLGTKELQINIINDSINLISNENDYYLFEYQQGNLFYNFVLNIKQLNSNEFLICNDSIKTTYYDENIEYLDYHTSIYKVHNYIQTNKNNLYGIELIDKIFNDKLLTFSQNLEKIHENYYTEYLNFGEYTLFRDIKTNCNDLIFNIDYENNKIDFELNFYDKDTIKFSTDPINIINIERNISKIFTNIDDYDYKIYTLYDFDINKYNQLSNKVNNELSFLEFIANDLDLFEKYNGNNNSEKFLYSELCLSTNYFYFDYLSFNNEFIINHSPEYNRIITKIDLDKTTKLTYIDLNNTILQLNSTYSESIPTEIKINTSFYQNMIKITENSNFKLINNTIYDLRILISLTNSNFIDDNIPIKFLYLKSTNTENIIVNIKNNFKDSYITIITLNY